MEEELKLKLEIIETKTRLYKLLKNKKKDDLTMKEIVIFTWLESDIKDKLNKE